MNLEVVDESQLRVFTPVPSAWLEFTPFKILERQKASTRNLTLSSSDVVSQCSPALATSPLLPRIVEVAQCRCDEKNFPRQNSVFFYAFLIKLPLTANSTASSSGFVLAVVEWRPGCHLKLQKSKFIHESALGTLTQRSKSIVAAFLHSCNPLKFEVHINGTAPGPYGGLIRVNEAGDIMFTPFETAMDYACCCARGDFYFIWSEFMFENDANVGVTVAMEEEEEERRDTEDSEDGDDEFDDEEDSEDDNFNDQLAALLGLPMRNNRRNIVPVDWGVRWADQLRSNTVVRFADQTHVLPGEFAAVASIAAPPAAAAGRRRGEEESGGIIVITSMLVAQVSAVGGVDVLVTKTDRNYSHFFRFLDSLRMPVTTILPHASLPEAQWKFVHVECNDPRYVMFVIVPTMVFVAFPVLFSNEEPHQEQLRVCLRVLNLFSFPAASGFYPDSLLCAAACCVGAQEFEIVLGVSRGFSCIVRIDLGTEEEVQFVRKFSVVGKAGDILIQENSPCCLVTNNSCIVSGLLSQDVPVHVSVPLSLVPLQKCFNPSDGLFVGQRSQAEFCAIMIQGGDELVVQQQSLLEALLARVAVTDPLVSIGPFFSDDTICAVGESGQLHSFQRVAPSEQDSEQPWAFGPSVFLLEQSIKGRCTQASTVLLGTQSEMCFCLGMESGLALIVFVDHGSYSCTVAFSIQMATRAHLTACGSQNQHVGVVVGTWDNSISVVSSWSVGDAGNRVWGKGNCDLGAIPLVAEMNKFDGSWFVGLSNGSVAQVRHDTVQDGNLVVLMQKWFLGSKPVASLKVRYKWGNDQSCGVWHVLAACGNVLVNWTDQELHRPSAIVLRCDEDDGHGGDNQQETTSSCVCLGIGPSVREEGGIPSLVAVFPDRFMIADSPSLVKNSNRRFVFHSFADVGDEILRCEMLKSITPLHAVAIFQNKAALKVFPLASHDFIEIPFVDDALGAMCVAVVPFPKKEVDYVICGAKENTIVVYGLAKQHGSSGPVIPFVHREVMMKANHKLRKLMPETQYIYAGGGVVSVMGKLYLVGAAGTASFCDVAVFNFGGLGGTAVSPSEEEDLIAVSNYSISLPFGLDAVSLKFATVNVTNTKRNDPSSPETATFVLRINFAGGEYVRHLPVTLSDEDAAKLFV